jgi:hypothetical protein
MAQRLTFKRRLSYNTTSNTRRVIKTPGGKLTLQYTKKRGSCAKYKTLAFLFFLFFLPSRRQSETKEEEEA